MSLKLARPKLLQRKNWVSLLKWSGSFTELPGCTKRQTLINCTFRNPSLNEPQASRHKFQRTSRTVMTVETCSDMVSRKPATRHCSPASHTWRKVRKVSPYSPSAVSSRTTYTPCNAQGEPHAELSLKSRRLKSCCSNSRSQSTVLTLQKCSETKESLLSDGDVRRRQRTDLVEVAERERHGRHVAWEAFAAGLTAGGAQLPCDDAQVPDDDPHGDEDERNLQHLPPDQRDALRRLVRSELSLKCADSGERIP